MHKINKIMTEVVSLWSNFMDGDYPDRKLFECESMIVVKYYGQKSARNDKYVGVGNHFFYKNKKNDSYKFAGKVVSSVLLGTEQQLHNGNYKNINIFELVIMKETQIEFRIKHDAYEHFGWAKVGQDFISGIIKHSLL